MKNQRGVTAISLMIIIVIIMILASFSIFTSRDLVIEGNIANIYNEVTQIKDSMKGLSLDDSYKDTILGTKKVTNIGEYNSRVGGNLVAGKEYYYLGFGDEATTDIEIQSLYEVLDLRAVERNYIVGIEDVGVVEVYLVDGIKIDGTLCYSYEEITDARASVTKK